MSFVLDSFRALLTLLYLLTTPAAASSPINDGWHDTANNEEVALNQKLC